MSGKISNLFNSLTSTDEKKRASASLYVEPASVHQLFSLIKRFGNFRLATTPLGFEVHLGQRRFTITDTFEFIQLTLHHADALTQEAAETTAELGFILLPQNNNPLRLQASSIDDERRLFQGVKKFFPNHAIRAFNQDQGFRLNFLEKKHQEKKSITTLSSKLSGISSNNSSGSAKAPINPNSRLGSLMGGFLKANEFGYKQSSVYIEGDSIGFLMAFTKENGEIEINSARDHFRLLLKGHVILIENYQELSAIRLISPLSLGAAELLLKLIEFMYGDMYGNDIFSSDNSENNLEQSPFNAFLPEGPGNLGSFETPANVLNPNHSFHPRNLNNPQNPLNSRSFYNPNNPFNPRSIYNTNNPLNTNAINASNAPRLRLSFETLHPDQEEFILKTLEKYASNPSYQWKLGYRTAEQKSRIEQYLNYKNQSNPPSIFN